MGLDSVVRSAVATIDQITQSLQATVQHAAWIDQDGFGKDVFAAPVTRKAMVEHKQRWIRRADGQMVLVRSRVTLLEPIAPNGAAGRQEPIDPRDIITLPDGTTGPIMDISGLVDAGTDAPYFHEVFLGTVVG